MSDSVIEPDEWAEEYAKSNADRIADLLIRNGQLLTQIKLLEQELADWRSGRNRWASW